MNGDRAEAFRRYSSRVFFRSIVGSRAFGLNDDRSDRDVRGIYVASASEHWSLAGAPESVACDATQEQYWEVGRFIRLAIRGNPGALEALFSPLVETREPLADDLLSIRERFLSRLIADAWTGFARHQFADYARALDAGGTPKWKSAMHGLRTMYTCLAALRTGKLDIVAHEVRERLLGIRQGEFTWNDVVAWRDEMMLAIDRARPSSPLPESPDVPAAEAFLVRARLFAVREEFPQ